MDGTLPIYSYTYLVLSQAFLHFSSPLSSLRSHYSDHIEPIISYIYILGFSSPGFLFTQEKEINLVLPSFCVRIG